MKQNETKQIELYEAPAVLDIRPVTINVAEGTSPDQGNGEPEGTGTDIE